MVLEDAAMNTAICARVTSSLGEYVEPSPVPWVTL